MVKGQLLGMVVDTQRLPRTQKGHVTLKRPILRVKTEVTRPIPTRRKGKVTPFQLGVGLGFAETDDAIAIFPLAAALEDFDTFKTLENIALGAQCARATKTRMLSHKIF